MSTEKIIMCWSGGKDSNLALYEILRSGQYDVVTLLTTLTEAYDRISMHGVRRILLEEQAQSLGLPLHKLFISNRASNVEYESKMKEALLPYKEKGTAVVAFGDIFLEDLREYRNKNLAKLGMVGLYPIWKRDTKELAHAFIDQGFKAYLTCVDTKVLGADFSGRLFNRSLLQDLPSSVDPCGERGEFHSFVTDGPSFQNEVKCATGEKHWSDRFCFCDLVPKKGEFVIHA